MKTLIIAISLTTFTTVSYAQVRNDLIGPAAKNYKPWKNKTKSISKLVSIRNKVNLRGPAAKNYKPWRSRTDVKYSNVEFRGKSKRMGPAAKNSKPWKRDD